MQYRGFFFLDDSIKQIFRKIENGKTFSAFKLRDMNTPQMKTFCCFEKVPVRAVIREVVSIAQHYSVETDHLQLCLVNF